MGHIMLQDYDRHDRVWTLNTRSGQASPASPASGRCHGFVRIPTDSSLPAAALFADAGKLWFQYGERRWDCAYMTAHQAVLPDGIRKFTVDGPRGRELELRYPAPSPDVIDATYDWIDTLADDFFLWVAEQLADPTARGELRDHYLKGFNSP